MSRMGTGQLARFCHRVGTGLQAGLDVLRIWNSEAERGSAQQRWRMAEIRDRVLRGASLAEALRQAGGYFPPLVCAMVEVGERTGRLDEIFLHLGEHYDHVLRLRRYFLVAIAWPVLELVLALAAIGALIWILGAMHAQWDGRPMAVFGLYGTRGLAVYVGILALIAVALGAAALAIKRGWLRCDPLDRLLMQLPGVGRGLRTMALSRLTWSLAMTTDSDLGADKAVELAVRSTENSYFTSRLEEMLRVIARREPLHAAFRAAGIYPDEFLDALETGEAAGQISESMRALGKVLEERAKNYARVLAAAAGAGVMLLVFAILIFLIFQLLQLYLAPIRSLLDGM